MKTHPCPHCKQPTAWTNNPWRPFCSERCKMIDLGMWAKEEYRVPGETVKSDSEVVGEEVPTTKDGEEG